MCAPPPLSGALRITVFPQVRRVKGRRTFWMRSATMGTSPRTAYFMSRSLAFMLVWSSALDELAGASRAASVDTMAAVRKKGNCVSDARKVVVRAADRRPTALFAVMILRFDKRGEGENHELHRHGGERRHTHSLSMTPHQAPRTPLARRGCLPLGIRADGRTRWVYDAQYDLSPTTFSPDGKVFQVDYAQKAVDTSGCDPSIRTGPDFCRPRALLHVSSGGRDTSMCTLRSSTHRRAHTTMRRARLADHGNPKPYARGKGGATGLFALQSARWVLERIRRTQSLTNEPRTPPRSS